MRVAELMRSDLSVAHRGTPIVEAIGIMADRHISALPVLDNHRRVVGVVSTTDILQAEAACGSAEERERLFRDGTVSEIMTTPASVIAPDMDLHEAAQQMLYLEVHRLFVESEGQLVGVISQSDIVRAVASSSAR